jgi:hypothetical protein
MPSRTSPRCRHPEPIFQARTRLKLLIQSIAGDMHAGAVAAALEGCGHQILFSVGTDVPTRQAFSFTIDEGGYAIEMRRDGLACLLDDSIDVVWSRRAKLFQLPAMHEDDVALAEREFRLFLGRLWELAAPRALWVNGWRARELASSKVVQLAAAVQCGFAVSPTLASHDPAAILAFVRKHGPDRLIFKPFAPMGWTEGERHFATPTTGVTSAMLEEPDDLRLCPGIYQRRIDKAKELRVTAMGSRLLCVQLERDDPGSGDVDWRVGPDQALCVTAVALPTGLRDRCRHLLARLDLRFGCLDLVVDADGDCYFLEVNEMGQFLWVEQFCPEERYLEAFLSFLCGLAGQTGPAEVRLAEVMAGSAFRRIMATTLAQAP